MVFSFLSRLSRFAIVALPVAGWLASGACASDTGAAAGTQCFSAIDCAAGLACVPKAKIYVCSSNLAAVESMLDAGMDAMSNDAGALPSFDTGTGTPPADTGAAPPPPDAGSQG